MRFHAFDVVDFAGEFRDPIVVAEDRREDDMAKHRNNRASDGDAGEGVSGAIGEIDDVFKEGEAEGDDDAQLDRIRHGFDFVIVKEADD